MSNLFNQARVKKESKEKMNGATKGWLFDRQKLLTLSNLFVDF